MRKGYVDTSQGQIHYRVKDGAGTPIICFHQTASSSAMFEKFAAEYDGSEPIYALDSPGFGGSFDPDGMPTMAEYADTLLDAIKALGFDKVHLFGHHTGASLAIEIATVDPSRVGSLMMIGPVVLTAEERQAFGGVYPQPFELKADGSHLQTMWDYVASIGGDSELDLHHREMVDTARAWQGHIKMYSKIWDQDFTALYEKITVPMFIMCAEKDILWPMFERAKEKRPDATAAVIPGSNFEPDEAPKEVASAVQGYLSSL
ncbi:MAG: alpha/beta fold hydrolase [Alphaproteobacteria bacterium]|nr:alpha/beta fold hydrolase [Alphaproteobacteria bacterium]